MCALRLGRNAQTKAAASRGPNAVTDNAATQPKAEGPTLFIAVRLHQMEDIARNMPSYATKPLEDRVLGQITALEKLQSELRSQASAIEDEFISRVETVLVMADVLLRTKDAYIPAVSNSAEQLIKQFKPILNSMKAVKMRIKA